MNWLVCLSTSPSLPLLDSRSDDNFERFDVNRASASRSNSSNSLLIRVFEQVYFTDENEEKWKKRIASIKLRSPSRRRINRLSNYWNSGICLTFFTSANKGQVVQYRGLVVNLKLNLHSVGLCSSSSSLRSFSFFTTQTTIIPRRLTYQKVKQPRACPSS